MPSSDKDNPVPVCDISIKGSVPTVNVGGLASVDTLKNNKKINLNTTYAFCILEYDKTFLSYMLLFHSYYDCIHV